MENSIDTLQQKIDGARAMLSKESREAIDSIDWKLIILGMKKYSADQLDYLEIETELLLCGITNPENYPIELEHRMLLTKEEASLLVGEMDKLIFSKIKNELEKRLNGESVSINVKINEAPLVFDPRFLAMPKGLQEAIARSNWKETIYKIGGEHKLNIEQMGFLEEITVKLISNTIQSDNYEKELSSKINISKEEMTSLVNDVNQRVLSKIQEYLKKYQEKKEVTIEYTSNKIPLPPYSKITTDRPEPIKPLILKRDDSFKMPEVPKNIMVEKLKNVTVSGDPYREEI